VGSQEALYVRTDISASVAIDYGWVLGNVKRLKKPIPCKGALGLWDVPPTVLRAIKRQLPAVKLDE
jgi:hypothetical protein